MKPLLLIVLVAAALGVWAGFSFGRSGTVTTSVHGALAVLMAASLLLSLWVWWRAKPGSGDAMVAPMLILVSGAMLMGALPLVLWPSHEGIQMTASIACAVVVTVAAVRQSLRARRLRAQQKLS